jgi:hypothetical protein
MNSLLASNIACLQQGIDFLRLLPPVLYRKKCPGIFGSTIGGHFRHNLDHFTAFLEGLSSGEVDYDARPRSIETERNPEIAIQLLEECLEGMKKLNGSELDKAIKIRMDHGEDSNWSRTTIRRELQFLLSHTIHHYALVVSIGSTNDYSNYPRDFGIAPSTIHFHQDQEPG